MGDQREERAFHQGPGRDRPHHEAEYKDAVPTNLLQKRACLHNGTGPYKRRKWRSTRPAGPGCRKTSRLAALPQPFDHFCAPSSVGAPSPRGIGAPGWAALRSIHAVGLDLARLQSRSMPAVGPLRLTHPLTDWITPPAVRAPAIPRQALGPGGRSLVAGDWTRRGGFDHAAATADLRHRPPPPR